MSKHQWNNIIFGALSLAFVYVYFFHSWSFWYWILLLLVWFSIVVYGSFSIRANYHLIAVNKLKTNSLQVALTFDDGPTPFTNDVLDILKSYQVKATFFCIGSQIELCPEIFQRIVAEGHAVGNHTYSHHRDMGFKSTKQLIVEIEQTNALIEKHSGRRSSLFRPPFGVTNPKFRSALEKTKMLTIGWTIRSLDTVIDDESKILKRIEKSLAPGSIILLHDTSDRTVQVLARLLKNLAELKYECVLIEPNVKL
jgi:peptidoglycan/xylan/chitin deacetylase (PgdA/CDA1 family)